MLFTGIIIGVVGLVALCWCLECSSPYPEELDEEDVES